MDTIGYRIKKLRNALDLTQSEFASKIGSVQNSVTGYETGRRNPSAPVVSLICKEFNVNEEWLRNGTGEMFKETSDSELDALAEKYNLSDADRIMVEKFICLKKEARDAIIDYIRDVCDSLSSSDGDADDIITVHIPPISAAHERTDIEVTDEMRKHDDAIMEDDSEWE